METKRRVTQGASAIALTCVIGVSRPTVALAQSPSGAPVKQLHLRCISSIDGKAQYLGYCANCHGTDGKGRGPDAVGLKLAPTDLTTIAQRNNGAFVRSRVEASITRWDRVNMEKMAVGDTSEVMPLFGPLFFKCYPDIPDRNMHLAQLVDYIKKLQEKSPTPRD